MKASVDKEACIGCGVCESICPDIFEMNDEGIAEGRDIEIPGEMMDSVKEAQSSCPTEAITIE